MGIFWIDWVTECKIDCRENSKDFCSKWIFWDKKSHKSVSIKIFAGAGTIITKLASALKSQMWKNYF